MDNIMENKEQRLAFKTLFNTLSAAAYDKRIEALQAEANVWAAKRDALTKQLEDATERGNHAAVDLHNAKQTTYPTYEIEATDTILRCIVNSPGVLKVFMSVEKRPGNVEANAINVVVKDIFFNGNNMTYPTQEPKFDNCRIIIYENGDFDIVRIRAGSSMDAQPVVGNVMNRWLPEDVTARISAAIYDGGMDFAIALIIMQLLGDLRKHIQ